MRGDELLCHNIIYIVNGENMDLNDESLDPSSFRHAPCREFPARTLVPTYGIRVSSPPGRDTGLYPIV